MHGEHEDTGVGVQLGNLPDKVNAAAPGHRNIDDDDIRFAGLEGLIAGRCVLRLGDDVDALMHLDQPAIALAHHGVIVDEQHADVRGHQAPRCKVGNST